MPSRPLAASVSHVFIGIPVGAGQENPAGTKERTGAGPGGAWRWRRGPAGAGGAGGTVAHVLMAASTAWIERLWVRGWGCGCRSRGWNRRCSGQTAGRTAKEQRAPRPSACKSHGTRCFSAQDAEEGLRNVGHGAALSQGRQRGENPFLGLFEKQTQRLKQLSSPGPGGGSPRSRVAGRFPRRPLCWRADTSSRVLTRSWLCACPCPHAVVAP